MAYYLVTAKPKADRLADCWRICTSIPTHRCALLGKQWHTHCRMHGFATMAALFGRKRIIARLHWHRKERLHWMNSSTN